MYEIDKKTGIIFLHEYFPYQRKWKSKKYTNRHFNELEGKRILDLKNRIPEAVDYYFHRMIKEFDDFLNEHNTSITVVPSHDPEYIECGIRDVAKKLAKYYVITDATDCLYRTKKISQQSRGGQRGRYIHIDSVDIRDLILIKGRSVILVDDVTTSGNSLSVCKEILEKAGASKVTCISLAKTFIFPLLYFI